MLPILPLCPGESISDSRELVLPVGRCVLTQQNKSTDGLVNTLKSETQLELSVLVLADASVDALIALLDAGAEYLFCSASQATELLDAGVPGSRLVCDKDVPETKGMYSAHGNERPANISQQLLLSGGARQHFVFCGRLPCNVYPSVCVAPVSELTRENIGAAVAEVLQTDRPDGLFTTLVVDKYDKALGLVYSSKDSIIEAFKTGTGVYQSRKRGLWYKGATSGAVQKLLRVDYDCDSDCLRFVVDQTAPGFCHLNTHTCFGATKGISALESTLVSRKANAPAGSYTARLFNDSSLLRAKIMEEAEELCDAKTKDEVSWEAADLVYFAMTRCVQAGVSWADVERNLDAKAKKISRRKGDAKAKWAAKEEQKQGGQKSQEEQLNKNAGTTKDLQMNRIKADDDSLVAAALSRPIQKTADIMKLVIPIVESVKTKGDAALLELTAKFDKVQLQSPVLKAPFPDHMMKLDDEVREAIDLSIANVAKFHQAQIDSDSKLSVETAPGVICSRFSRPIESVGLYVPGGTAVLPSTAIHLGVPAKVAGCKNIVVASPPRADGSITPEVVYVAHKIGAGMIVLAGGAQAVAAMAYGTASIPKVDKIAGPGNQFVTAAKMYVQNDTSALVSIDMPAGPSEVLVIADESANPAFVASDLLSQAEHGVDSQVILIAAGMTEAGIKAIEKEVYDQAMALPRVDIVRGSLAHSTIIEVPDIEAAMTLSNKYAPEHLILQVNNASSLVPQVENAGSVFVGAWSPESCGDYSSGTNHTLPTYGYARMYSGVNTGTFMKHITSQELSQKGLQNIGPAVMALAAREGLDGHRNAVKVRLDNL